ncbi:MAG: discoidin domain-containing protein, partial [Thermoguttaceae bacterium]|nr:discoidin domain-containing protein [Thermoguttaceae bacterium]
MQTRPRATGCRHWALIAAATVSVCVAASKAQAAERPAPKPPKAVDVGEAVRAMVEADWIDRDRRFGGPAVQSKAQPVTTAQDAAGGCDGIKNGSYGFHTASAEQDPWWQVDLGKVYALDRVVVYNRTERNTAARTKNLRVLVSDRPGGEFKVIYQHQGEPFLGVLEKKPLVVDLRGKGVSARIVRLDVPGRCSFALDEVEVYAADDPQKNIALGKPADQKSVGQYSVAKTPGAAASPAAPGAV